MSPTVRRLVRTDAGEFQRLRTEGFRLHEREFRFSPEDEAGTSLDDVAARLARDFVAGSFLDGAMVGIVGFTRFAGAKLDHRGLLWGMYLRAELRGSGAADRLMSAVVYHAGANVETVALTVVEENRRAIRFYERWGFRTYAVEPASIRLADGSYLGEALMLRRFASRPEGCSPP